MAVLVGKKAPMFNVPAVLGNGEIGDNFDFSEALAGKYGFFLYPCSLHLYVHLNLSH